MGRFPRLRILSNKDFRGLSTCLLCIVEVLMLCYYNVFHLSDVVDYDFAKDIRHAIEVGTHMKLFLPSWNYTTTGEFDCPMILAAFLYSFLRNIFKAWSIANILSLLICIGLILFITQLLGLKKEYIGLCIAILLTPFNWGNLGYVDMTFVGQGSYIYKTLIPICLVCIMSRLNEQIKLYDILLMALFAGLLLLTTISSGVYVLACGVMPVFLCVGGYLLLGKFKGCHRRILGVVALSTGISAVGIILNKKHHIGSRTYGLQPINRVWDTLYDFTRLFYNPDGQSITSVNGFQQLINLIILLFIIFFGCVSLLKAFCIFDYIKFLSRGVLEREYRKTDFIESCLASICVMNFGVLIITNSFPRYHLLGAFPLVILSCVNFQKMKKFDDKTKVPSTLFSVITGAILLIGILSFKYTHDVFFRFQDDTNHFMKDLTEVLDSTDAGTTFIVGGDGDRLSEMLRAYDITRNYEALMLNDTGYTISNTDYYDTACDKSAFTDNNLLLLRTGETTIDDFPTYVSDNYTLVSEIRERNYTYKVYFSSSCPFDGRNGFSPYGSTIDLPVSKDYVANGTIDENGFLHSSELGIIMSSAGLVYAGRNEYDIVLTYETDKMAKMYLDLYLNMNLIQSIPMDAQKDSVRVNVSNIPGEYIYAVRNEGGEGVIKNIYFQLK